MLEVLGLDKSSSSWNARSRPWPPRSPRSPRTAASNWRPGLDEADVERRRRLGQRRMRTARHVDDDDFQVAIRLRGKRSERSFSSGRAELRIRIETRSLIARSKPHSFGSLIFR
jgi:hypothetical protein